jgi:hypothetical protein
MTFQQTILADDRHAQQFFSGSWVPKEIRFTALEWQVIALAERDPMSSIREPGRLASAMGSIFGSHAHAKLADERLEALRRVAVIVWHEPVLSDDDIADFIDAGFSHDQLHLLRRSIRRRRIAALSLGDLAPLLGFGIGVPGGSRAQPATSAAAGASA